MQSGALKLKFAIDDEAADDVDEAEDDATEDDDADDEAEDDEEVDAAVGAVVGAGAVVGWTAGAEEGAEVGAGTGVGGAAHAVKATSKRLDAKSTKRLLVQLALIGYLSSIRKYSANHHRGASELIL